MIYIALGLSVMVGVLYALVWLLLFALFDRMPKFPNALDAEPDQDDPLTKP